MLLSGWISTRKRSYCFVLIRKRVSLVPARKDGTHNFLYTRCSSIHDTTFTWLIKTQWGFQSVLWNGLFARKPSYETVAWKLHPHLTFKNWNRAMHFIYCMEQTRQAMRIQGGHSFLCEIRIKEGDTVIYAWVGAFLRKRHSISTAVNCLRIYHVQTICAQ